jgi:hypothetical protein
MTTRSTNRVAHMGSHPELIKVNQELLSATWETDWPTKGGTTRQTQWPTKDNLDRALIERIRPKRWSQDRS